MSKRLVLCCDGTWNTPDETKKSEPAPTNVTKLALAVAGVDGSGIEQRMAYHRGVGTGNWDHLTGGAFGVGLSQGVMDTYRFIVENYDPGDELFFFGFSRGAFTARSTAGLVRNAGILRRENLSRIGDAYALYRSRQSTAHPSAIESELFRSSFSHRIGDETVPRIRFIGVWDTVGALGIPLNGSRIIARFNRRWQFHDTALSSYVDAAFQALAIDEKRGPFRPTLWTGDVAPGQIVKQVWFPGVHCDVGGGYHETGLSDITLQWMADRAVEHGLVLRPNPFSALPSGADGANPVPFSPNKLADAHTSRKSFYRLTPAYVRPIDEIDPDKPRGINESEASTAADRVQDREDYTPANLLRYEARGDRQITDTEP